MTCCVKTVNLHQPDDMSEFCLFTIIYAGIMYMGCGRAWGGMRHWSTLTMDNCGNGCGKGRGVDGEVSSWEIRWGVDGEESSWEIRWGVDGDVSSWEIRWGVDGDVNSWEIKWGDVWDVSSWEIRWAVDGK